MKKQKHSIDVLKTIFRFDPEIGRFIRLIDRSSKSKAGDIAGSFRADGYREISYEKVGYREHILAWAFHYGEWPSSDIDHKDGNPSNNKISNIRLASKSQNMTNCKTKKSNKVGFKGVVFHQGWYVAQITQNYRTTRIGKFSTPEDAHAAYIAKAKEFFGEFARPM